MNSPNSVTRFGNFYYQIRLDALRQPPLIYILQYLEQEGMVRPNLSICGNKIYIYGHTESKRLDNASKVQSENTVNYNDKQSKHTRKSATSDGATSGSSRNRYHKQDKEIPGETPNRNRKSQTCRNCGGKFPHKNGMESCPARGKQCHNCQKMGHFAKYCKSSPKPKGKVRSVTDNNCQHKLR